MSFYIMQNAPRRITNFIQREAYKWLQNKVRNEEYIVRKGTEVRNLMNSIRNQGFTPNTYAEFIKRFENNPYSYAIQLEKHQSVNSIHTDNVMNYFIEYHGTVLPMGFIIEFFEDDYETEDEIKKVIDAFLSFSKTEFSTNYQNQIADKQNAMDDIAVDCKCGYKPSPKIFITGFITLTLTLAIIYFGVFFLMQIEFFPVMEQFCGVENFNFYSDIDISNGLEKEITAYISNEHDYLVSGDFDMEDYLSIYGVGIILVLTALLANVFFALYQVYYFIRKLINGITVNLYVSTVEKLDALGVQGILAEADDILVGRDHCIDKFDRRIAKLYSKNLHRLTKYDTENVETNKKIHLGKLRSVLECFINGGRFRRMGLYYGGAEDRGMSGLRWFYLFGALLLAAMMSLVVPEIRVWVESLLGIS